MKHSNFLGIALACGLLCSILPLGNGQTASADSVDLADESFIQFVTDDTTYEGELSYTHTPLYDENLQVHGREYDFSIGQVQGYALMAEIQHANGVYYEIEELFYSATSPFDDCEGLPVYVDHRLYLDFVDDAFYNLTTGEEVSVEEVSARAQEGFLYFGMGNGTIQNYFQTVNYATKSTQTYSIQYDLPNYGPQSDPVDCANVAGCIVIGYYDRLYENLIPNFVPYTVFGPIIVYKLDPPEIYTLGPELSNLMGGGNGTTFSGFQAGMASYVTGKGYSYSSQSMFTNGNFDYSKYKQAVEANKPVALFMSGFSMLIDIGENGTYDNISNDYVNAAHVMVGCGYRTDTYYNASGSQVAVRRYLKVASGTVSYNIGYMNIDGTGHIDNAVSIDIH